MTINPITPPQSPKINHDLAYARRAYTAAPPGLKTIAAIITFIFVELIRNASIFVYNHTFRHCCRSSTYEPLKFANTDSSSSAQAPSVEAQTSSEPEFTDVPDRSTAAEIVYRDQTVGWIFDNYDQIQHNCLYYKPYIRKVSDYQKIADETFSGTNEDSELNALYLQAKKNAQINCEHTRNVGDYYITYRQWREKGQEFLDPLTDKKFSQRKRVQINTEKNETISLSAGRDVSILPSRED